MLASMMTSMFFRVYLFLAYLNYRNNGKDLTQIEYNPDITRVYISLNSLATGKITLKIMIKVEKQDISSKVVFS